MVKFYRKRRAGVRRGGRMYRKRAIARWGAPPRNFQYKRSKTGFVKIVRKLPEITVSSSSSAGIATLTQNLAVGAPACVTLATPVQSTGAAGTTSYDIPFSMQFALSQIINHTDVTNLADKYKIVGAYVRVYYNKTNASVNSTGPYPHMQYITDHDDSNVPTLTQLREKMGVKFSTFQNASSYIGMKCRPTAMPLVYSSALVNGYSVPGRPMWIDSATDGVPHYGIKGVISNFNLPANANIELLKFDVALKILAKDIQ